MKRLLAIAASTWMLAAPAAAQTPAAAAGAPTETSYYINGLVAASLADVQSQAVSVEIGMRVTPSVHGFIEVGRLRDTAPAALGENARLIAEYVSLSQAGLSYQVKQPVTLFQVGARYALKPHGHYAPYLIGSGGLARLTRDVAFSVGRNEITDRLSQYGVTLGSDLTGDVSKLAATVGGGIAWTRFAPFSIGLDYRYSRIFDTTALSVNRAGLMFGVTF